MSVVLRHSAFALGLSLFAASAAHATTVSGTASFADSSNNNNLAVSGTFEGTSCSSHCSFSERLTLGGPDVTDSDFLTVFTNLGGYGDEAKTDTVSVSFNITNPGAGSGSASGSASETQTVSFRGWYSTTKDDGSVSWGTPASILLSDGDILTIGLANTGLSSEGCDCGNYDDCGNVAATFSLTDPAPTAATPEPGSITLFGTGLVSVAGLIRRRIRG